MLLFVVWVSSGCQFFGQRSSLPTYYNLPLTVQLRMDHSIAAASLDSRDACGQSITVPIRDGLEAQLKKRMGQVFERVHFESNPSTGAVDGVVDTALGFRQVDLFIPRKANKSYPATVTLGMEFSYTDHHGAVLMSKKLQSAATGEVETRADTCTVSGIDKVAEEAAAKLVEGMAQQLGTATKIREQAQFRKSGDRGTMPSAPVAPATPAAAPSVAAPVVPVAPLQSVAAGFTPQAAAPDSAIQSGQTQLSFRTIIRDDNQNHVLEQRESFSVEFEVKNEGAVVAEGVEVELSGHAAIVGGLTSPVSLGTLQPGEVRRVAVDGKVGAVADAEQAELMCTLRASSNVLLPSAKKFFVAIRPDAGAAVEVLSVDVDQLPSRNGKSVQRNSVGIAIGIGAFRDPAVPPMKFAAHDAEVMGGYLKTVLGVPPHKVKVLSDEKALKDDLIEVFEQWLPKQGGPQVTAYIYASGRAVVDQETGVVSLLPYDGTRVGASRVFSLARLQRALTKASVKQAVLMLDLSLEPSAGSDPGRVVPPRWAQQDSSGESDRVMLMIGNSGLQEAQAYQPGQHGLFTYFLLKGLRGAADLDKSGTVFSGELCEYVHDQVDAVTRGAAGSGQPTLCLPMGDRHPVLTGIPLSKLR